MSVATSNHIRLDLDVAGAIMTPEEFDAVTDYNDLYRYELIRGVLVVNPIPGEGEVDPNEHLGYLLRTYQQGHPQGAALDKTLPERYVYTHDSRRRADRVIWAGLGRRPNPKEDSPTIVVEFVSRSRRDWQRDYVEKKKEYLELGVAEYWVIDRFRRMMTVYRPPAADPREVVVGENETFTTELLPGFELPLAAVLKVADAWSEDQN